MTFSDSLEAIGYTKYMDFKNITVQDLKNRAIEKQIREAQSTNSALPKEFPVWETPEKIAVKPFYTKEDSS